MRNMAFWGKRKTLKGEALTNAENAVVCRMPADAGAVPTEGAHMTPSDEA